MFRVFKNKIKLLLFPLILKSLLLLTDNYFSILTFLNNYFLKCLTDVINLNFIDIKVKNIFFKLHFNTVKQYKYKVR